MLKLTPEADAWIRDGRATVLPAHWSNEFDNYLRVLPWFPSKLDWTRMPPSESLDVSQENDDDFRRWLRSTALGRNTHAAVWYSEDKGGIVLSMKDVSTSSLDELHWKAPGIRFVFGINVSDDDEWTPRYADLLQYGDGDFYYAVSRRALLSSVP